MGISNQLLVMTANASNKRPISLIYPDHATQVISLKKERVALKITFDFEWTIEKYFDLAATRTGGGNDSKDVVKESPVFEISHENLADPYQFTLSIQPKEPRFYPTEDGAIIKNVQCRVNLINKNDKDVTADYNIYGKKKDGERQNITNGTQWCFKTNQEGSRVFGYHSWTFLEENQEEYVPCGNLTVGCQITVKIPEDGGTHHSVLENNLQSQKTLIKALSESFDITKPENIENYERFADFTILCGENLDKRYRCHKSVLYLRSPVFSAMFSHDTIETTKNQVEIPDISPGTIEKMLQFLYTDDVKDNMIDIELLEAADKYKIDRLKAVCEKSLGSQLTIANSTEIGISAHLHGSKQFEHEVIKFLSENWREVRNVQGAELIKSYPDLLYRIVSYFTDMS